ncbi:hypothetical protein [Streptomyces scopuliridis]|uniref:hypothetical protein n=1 Tax=Streptomyces scopuliridis TaxID=452529 RepID=UPI0034240A2F
MPLECADWLLKPTTHIRTTFGEPKEAADWFAEQLVQHYGNFAGTYAPTVADPDAIVRRLSEGDDVVGGWWVTGGRFLSLSLIACSPHRVRRDYVCPVR